MEEKLKPSAAAFERDARAKLEREASDRSLSTFFFHLLIRAAFSI